MSFEPQLIINYSDLVRESSVIEQSETEEDSFLFNLLKGDPVAINLGYGDGIPTHLYVCRPELTSFNERVRDRLDELNIRFGLDY